jgi:hypothetical protein
MDYKGIQSLTFTIYSGPHCNVILYGVEAVNIIQYLEFGTAHNTSQRTLQKCSLVTWSYIYLVCLFYLLIILVTTHSIWHVKMEMVQTFTWIVLASTSQNYRIVVSLIIIILKLKNSPREFFKKPSVYSKSCGCIGSLSKESS